MIPDGFQGIRKADRISVLTPGLSQRTFTCQTFSFLIQYSESLSYCTEKEKKTFSPYKIHQQQL